MSMSRREFTRRAVIAAAGLRLGGLASAAEKDAPRPNIILFISDDHGFEDSGAYGNEIVRTPNIDGLAREAMRFTRAFAASPLCSPSRSVLETGLMPFRNGGHKFGTPIRPNVRTMPMFFRELGYHTAHIGKFHHTPDRQFPYDTVIRDENSGQDFLSRYDGAKPLLLLVCSTFPHTPWAKNETYDPAKVRLPPNFVDTPETRLDRCRYYTEVTMMDRQLGAVLDALKQRGWQDNTLVMYTTDQGSNWPFAKWCLYDAGIRVPLIARWPGRIKPGSVTDAMVSLCDLMPTFLDAAGAQPPEGIDGRSFLGILKGDRKEHRDAVFACHTGNDNGGPGVANDCPMRAVRTATHKYIVNLHPERTFYTHIVGCKQGDPHHLPFWNTWVRQAKTDKRAAEIVDRYLHRPPEELYDIRKDPYEQHNLAADPAQAEVLDLLRKQLAEWRKQQGDPEFSG
jgi:arylsulfatase A-like enzyme